MVEREIYELGLRARAIQGGEIKWLRNITITLLAGVATTVSGVGATRVKTLLVTWGFAAMFFVAWEWGAYLRRRFYLAPYAEHEQQADALVQLEAELTSLRNVRLTQEQRKDLAKRLSRMVERATNELWVKRPKGQPAIDEWRKAISNWHMETLQIMEQGGCSESEIASVRTLGNLALFNPSNHRYANDQERQRGMIMIDGYRQRLEPIIRRYDA